MRHYNLEMSLEQQNNLVTSMGKIAADDKAEREEYKTQLGASMIKGEASAAAIAELEKMLEVGGWCAR